MGAWGGFEPERSWDEFISGDVLSSGGILRVEVHSRVSGVRWGEVRRRQVPGKILGVPANFASLDDLIARKEAAGRREKDLPDLKRWKRFRERGGR
ncbi:MAG: hypothetical protein ACUVYA_15015 [Planctomycetota bacterium]